MPKQDATQDLIRAITHVETMGLPFIYEGVRYSMGEHNTVSCRAVQEIPLPRKLCLLNGVTKIAPLGFCEMSIDTVYIPDTVTILGAQAFRGSSITKCKVSPNTTAIGSYCFGDCINLITLDLRCAATVIEPGLCYGCTSLREVWLPQNLKNIMGACFTYCHDLQKIHMPRTELPSLDKSLLWRDGEYVSRVYYN